MILEDIILVFVMMEKNFRCSIWGEIEVSSLALSIIDTWEFQRLHYIKQTGLAYKVFPTATSSRFEHSIGVYHITKIMIEHLEKSVEDENKLNNREKELLCIVGLVHDIGHGPFSHLFDFLVERDNIKSIPKEHEKRGCFIFEKMVKENKIDLSMEEVDWICERILNPSEEKWYNILVYNPYYSFDMDKLDYLIRDMKHFGISCPFDVFRIIKNTKVIKNKICFCDRIYNDIKKLFEIREEMHALIYRHPTIEKFSKFLHENIKLKEFTMDEFLEMNDISLLNNLPKQKWRELETRKWNSFHEENKMELFKDEQKKKAFENILWYKRKDPTFFFIKK